LHASQSTITYLKRSANKQPEHLQEPTNNHLAEMTISRPAINQQLHALSAPLITQLHAKPIPGGWA
jgi:hypothetical protein